ncbi:hypothetical protein [Sphingopyxis terrae]|uniref:hypothetical protein n=1 Tax=Sphingopyxis terrae TaxID=33052 RepID=UPI00363E2A61
MSHPIGRVCHGYSPLGQPPAGQDESFARRTVRTARAKGFACRAPPPRYVGAARTGGRVV